MKRHPDHYRKVRRAIRENLTPPRDVVALLRLVDATLRARRECA